MYALGLSLVFVIIDAAAFALLVEPLHFFWPIQPAWLNNMVHGVLISLVGTFLGCLSFGAVRSKARLVPMGYSFFPAYVFICLAYGFFNLEGTDLAFFANLICTYTLPPTITGMLVSWTLYHVLKRRKTKR